MKKLANPLIRFLIIFLSSIFILTIINYLNLLNSTITSIIRFLIPSVSIFISSFYLGTISEKKGYIEGLKFGSIIVLSFALVSLILDKLSVRSILYYLILLIISILSSMLGINYKANKNEAK